MNLFYQSIVIFKSKFNKKISRERLNSEDLHLLCWKKRMCQLLTPRHVLTQISSLIEQKFVQMKAGMGRAKRIQGEVYTFRVDVCIWLELLATELIVAQKFHRSTLESLLMWGGLRKTFVGFFVENLEKIHFDVLIMFFQHRVTEIGSTTENYASSIGYI